MGLCKDACGLVQDGTRDIASVRGALMGLLRDVWDREGFPKHDFARAKATGTLEGIEVWIYYITMGDLLHDENEIGAGASVHEENIEREKVRLGAM